MKYSMIIFCFGRPSSLSFKMFLNSLLHRLQTQFDDQLDYFLYTCDVHIIGVSKAKPLSSGWCKNRKFGTSQLRNSFWYVAVAQ